MIVSFATKPISVMGRQYDWTESTEIQYLIKERTRIASEVASGKMTIKITLATGEELVGQEAVNMIPYMGIAYRLSLEPTKLIVREVILNPNLGISASCIAAINRWRNTEQRDTEQGEMIFASYFNPDNPVDWIVYKLPVAAPAT